MSPNPLLLLAALAAPLAGACAASTPRPTQPATGPAVYEARRTHEAARSADRNGDRRTAAELYARYLASVPGSDDVSSAESRLAELEKDLGRVSIRAPAGTRVTIDGRAVQTRETFVEPGIHKVHATLGTRELRYDFATHAGSTKRITLFEDSAVKPVEGDAPLEEIDPPTDPKRTWGWVLVGTSAAFVATTVYSAQRVSSVNSDSEYDEYRAQFAKDQDVCDAANDGVGSNSARIRDLCGEAQTFQTLGLVSAGLALATGATGLVLLLNADGDAQERGEVALGADVGPSSLGATVRASF